MKKRTKGPSETPDMSGSKRSKVLGEEDSMKEKDAAEEALERMVFGGETEFLDKLQDKYSSEEELSEDESEEEDEEEDSEDGEDDEENADRHPIHKHDKNQVERAPAWEDEDDAAEIKIKGKDKDYPYLKSHRTKEMTGEAYKQTLQTEFEKISGTPSWAKLDKKKMDADSDSEDEELLQTTGNYITASQFLPKGLIQMKKCQNANKEHPSTGKLKSVEFHPTAQVILTAGMNQTLSLFQVDGKHNPKIQSIFLDKFPIHCAHFNTSGEEVIMGTLHASFRVYDMMAGKVVRIPTIKGMEEKNTKRFQVSPDGKILAFLGKDGFIHLVSAKSKEWISSVKMNGSVEAVAFNRDGSQMFSHGGDGNVYVWDMNTRDCVHRFTDDGCIRGTTVQVSQNNQYIACGSYSGVVNIYDQTCLTSSQPKPVKAVMNLTTPCTSLRFNSTTEILAMASDYTERAVRLLHFPSMTVFSNFPDPTDNMRIPLCMDFSLHSGYFCIGNHKGEALLYRAKHYSNY